MSDEPPPDFESLVTHLVRQRIAITAGTCLALLDGAMGGLEHLSVEEAKLYAECLRVLEALRQRMLTGGDPT